jgi:hypothetical protein
MKLFFRALLLPLALFAVVAAAAQGPMPRAAFVAKTVAILNDTKTGEVSDGALEQLKRWGRLTLVDDAESADIVLRFDKKTDREQQNSQSTDDKGATSWSATTSFSSQVHMRAYLKGSDTPFYTTKTDDSKKKAGVTCVTSFEKAWLDAR